MMAAELIHVLAEVPGDTLVQLVNDGQAFDIGCTGRVTLEARFYKNNTDTQATREKMTLYFAIHAGPRGFGGKHNASS